MPRDLLPTFLLLIAPPLFAAGETSAPPVAGPATEDPRHLVTMPAEARALMRQDMLSHLTTLSELIGLLASNDLAAAAEVAESRMGNSSMGKHRASGMGPGMFMPPEMRNMGWNLHAAASEFAKVAREGNAQASYSALQTITTTCIVCHNSYRTR